MSDPLDTAAGWLAEHFAVPLLWHLGLMRWEELAYGWALFVVYGALQVGLMYAVCLPLERFYPIERWPDRRAVAVDVFYTLLARVGLLPLTAFVLFFTLEARFRGWLADHGYVPPTLERLVPALLGHPGLTFLIYALILDYADYWRHRLSHRFGWWYALHALHHAQRRMSFWSDDRNHLLDDFIAALWFGAIALLIGVPPLQFPLLVLVLRFLESLSHANTRLSFGRIGNRLLVSPIFHRTHHAIPAAGAVSCNYGAVFPFWDILHGTARFIRRPGPTGDPTADEALATGSYLAQQWSGLKSFFHQLLPQGRPS